MKEIGHYVLQDPLGPLPVVRMVGILIISFGGGAPKVLRVEKREPWRYDVM